MALYIIKWIPIIVLILFFSNLFLFFFCKDNYNDIIGNDNDNSYYYNYAVISYCSHGCNSQRSLHQGNFFTISNQCIYSGTSDKGTSE